MPMIRAMMMKDITDCLAIGQAAHFDSLYKHIPFDPTEAALTLIQHIESNACFTVVCELDGEVSGFMLGSLQRLMFSSQCIAVDTTILVDPYSRGIGIARQMVSAFTAWATYMDAKLICVSSSSGQRVRAEGLTDFKNAGVVLIREVNI